MLKFGIVGPAQCISVWKRHEQSAWRFRPLRMFFQQNETARRQTGGFHCPCEHTDRVRAIGSGRRQNCGSCSVLEKKARYFRPGFLQDPLRVCLRAHERVVVRCPRGDHALLDQFQKAVARKGDVQIPVNGRAIEADAVVALQNIAVWSMCGNRTIALISRTERTVATAVQARCSDQSQPDILQRLAQRNEWRTVVLETGKIQHRVALDITQIFNARHRANCTLPLMQSLPLWRSFWSEMCTEYSRGNQRKRCKSRTFWLRSIFRCLPGWLWLMRAHFPRAFKPG